MNTEVGFVGLAVLCVLLLVRVPLAVAMAGVAYVGTGYMVGWPAALSTLATTPYNFTASWTLSAIPMFLLMGYVSFYANLTNRLFDAARVVFRMIPGGLGIACIMACSGFAAACGSSLAGAAAMGRIAIPRMVAQGYHPGIACGLVAAGGTLGALIPPSILMILYCVFTETAVTPVFLGGISVGLLTAFGYCVVIYLVALFRPHLIPREAQDRDGTTTGQALGGVAPIIALILLVFGGMFGGLFTATEAGAVGAVGAILLAWFIGQLNTGSLLEAIRETLVTCSALFFVGVGTVLFTRFLSLSGVTGLIGNAFSDAGMSYWQIMLIIVLIYLVLGMFMEPLGAMLVTLPILLPILEANDLSLIWFGVVVVKLLEIGMITPPIGMNVFVIRSVASDYASLSQMFAGAVLFIVSDIFVLAAIIAFPSIVLFLPRLLG
ncbi:TRAP transporter large permease subunit [Pseudooceanicola sp. 216_PA32_1]|uniref:TRAP transporter large permease subunit n=1 Tax=Pseudooceanicola pacificus TaxID=2676438 RepID=A0A844W3B3_9RHOB|nr:TRAP transporter large permease [Pseudooceanicola pacificus]MWB78287.1 TRAP transporter large permease subunit [Pseudooceanicola pacificus]